jgi:hypothetical protein
MVPYWVSQSPSQGTFPEKNLSKSCSECEVDLGKTSRYGVEVVRVSFLELSTIPFLSKLLLINH